MLSHFYPGDKGYKPMLLHNVGNHLQQYMLSQPRKPQSTCSPDEISSSQGDQYQDGCLIGMLLHVIFSKLTEVSKAFTASIIREITLMMEAVSTFETSVGIYQTVL
jgi:hypothetical protein